MNDAFVQSLADIAEERGSEAFLVELRDSCMAKIAEGGGEVTFMKQAGQNGKTAQAECILDASELLVAVTAALRLFRDQTVTVTYVDFSGMIL